MLKLALKSVVFVSGAVTVIDLIGGPAVVQGSSMEPTLNPDGSIVNDVAWLNRFASKIGAIERGDIVTIYCPTEPNEMHIKRIIGLPGDLINTESSPRPVQVPQGHCWVEGDNRNLMASTFSGGTKRMWTSKDSNVYGPVSLGLLDARVSWVIFPPHRVRRLKRTTPNAKKYFCKGKYKDVAESLLEADSS